MPTHQNQTRQRLINAALELFAARGVTETTTKQIAEFAEVNEVTLFRQFGNKYGLLLAVIEEAAVFTEMGQRLVQQADQTSSIYQALKDYADACLQALERIPEVVRSVVGEAGQYPAENRVALGRGFTQANQYVATYFETVINQGQLRTYLSAEKLASLLNSMVLGYAVIEFTSEFHQLWRNREDFLENLVTLFLQGAVASTAVVDGNPMQAPSRLSGTQIRDLPAHLVHTILQRAKQQGLQEYALIYILFGAGLSASEVAQLARSHHMSDRHQQLLQITQGAVRQVPVNQWIMGKRYGSYIKNPLTQWLKSRKDSQMALFIDATEQPLSEAAICHQWQTLTADLSAPDGQPLTIEQAQQTWRVEMLSRGVTLEDLQILTGQELNQLQPYAQRAREKTALEQAIRIDRKA
jgi:AcrR family transcriptional regulator